MKTTFVLLLLSQLSLFANITTEATALLKGLTLEQKEALSFPFGGEERENWHYVPTDREGVMLNHLNEAQQKQVHSLLGQSLSAQGHATAKEVIQLESILYERSNQSEFRNPGKYTIAIFGTPSPEKPWGWRFEGHHLSLNFTIINEKVTLTTPFFFGTNPAEVSEGTHKGLRPLGKIEDAARKLARAIHGEGQHVRFSSKPPREILTGQDRTAKALAQEGASYTETSDTHQADLLALVKMIAAHQQEKFLTVTARELTESQFAWAGEFDKGEPHYFRVQTPEFLIEYANTQNGANHAHLVWRNFENDFGRDILKEHLKHDH